MSGSALLADDSPARNTKIAPTIAIAHQYRFAKSIMCHTPRSELIRDANKNATVAAGIIGQQSR
jgi:hypothetical protein